MAHIPKIILLIFLAWPRKKSSWREINKLHSEEKNRSLNLLRWICASSRSDSCYSSGSLAAVVTLPGKGIFLLHQMPLLSEFLLCSLFSFAQQPFQPFHKKAAAAENCSSACYRGTTSAKTVPEWWVAEVVKGLPKRNKKYWEIKSLAKWAVIDSRVCNPPIRQPNP